MKVLYPPHLTRTTRQAVALLPLRMVDEEFTQGIVLVASRLWGPGTPGGSGYDIHVTATGTCGN